MKKMSVSDEKKNRILFFIILLTAIFVRTLYFGSIPNGINQDEAMAAMDAKALLSYGTDRLGMRFPVHFTAWGWAQMSVLLSYLMVPFIALFGFTTVAVRCPSLIVSIAGLLFLYFFIKEIYNRKTALWVFFLASICPWHILQSRWSLDCNLFPHLFVIGCFLLLLSLKKKFCLYLSMIFFALCLYSYGVSVYSVPLFLFVTAVYLYRKKLVSLKSVIISVLIFGLISLPELLTMFINLVGIDTIETPLFTIPYFPGTVRSKDILITNFSFGQLFKNIWFTFKSSFLQTPDLFHNTIPLFGTVYHLSFPFIFLGIYKLFKDFKRSESCQERNTKQFGCFLLLAWFFMGIWIGIITKEVNVNRINVIHYSLICMTALGILFAIQKISRLKFPVLALYCILFLAFTGTYFTGYARESKEAYHGDLLEVFEFTDSLPVSHVYVSTDEDPQTMEILMQYALKTDSKYYRQLTNICNGKEYLPYSERYRFFYLGGDYIDWKMPGTAYLVTRQEWEHLDSSAYTVYDYGRYRLYVHD